MLIIWLSHALNPGNGNLCRIHPVLGKEPPPLHPHPHTPPPHPLHPPPPHPHTPHHTHTHTHFRERGGIFSMGGANSRNQEKDHFAGMSIYYHVFVPHVGIVMHTCI